MAFVLSSSRSLQNFSTSISLNWREDPLKGIVWSASHTAFRETHRGRVTSHMNFSTSFFPSSPCLLIRTSSVQLKVKHWRLSWFIDNIYVPPESPSDASLGVPGNPQTPLLLKWFETENFSKHLSINSLACLSIEGGVLQETIVAIDGSFADSGSRKNATLQINNNRFYSRGDHSECRLGPEYYWWWNIFVVGTVPVANSTTTITSITATSAPFTWTNNSHIFAQFLFPGD